MIPTTIHWAVVGGALLGVGAAVLLLFNGQIAGIGGNFRGLINLERADIPWRIAFIAGLICAGVIATQYVPEMLDIGNLNRSGAVIAIAGFISGIGCCVQNGCTSGHGVCGMSRMSVRSMTATGVFFVVAFLTVLVIRVVFGGAL